MENDNKQEHLDMIHKVSLLVGELNEYMKTLSTSGYCVEAVSVERSAPVGDNYVSYPAVYISVKKILL